MDIELPDGFIKIISSTTANQVSITFGNKDNDNIIRGKFRDYKDYINNVNTLFDIYFITNIKPEKEELEKVINQLDVLIKGHLTKQL